MSTSTDVSPSHEVGRWGREAVATLLATTASGRGWVMQPLDIA